MNNGMHNLSVLQQKTNTAVEATGGMEATEAGEKRDKYVLRLRLYLVYIIDPFNKPLLKAFND